MVSVGDARLTLAPKLKYFVTTILPLYIIESITITILQVSGVGTTGAPGAGAPLYFLGLARI